MEVGKVRYYEFGEFRLDTRRRVLLQNEHQIPLSAKIFDLLLVLVQNEGRVLDHEELLDKVWEGMFVEQSNLKKGISVLRHILGEQPNESLYIKTVPRRGYSFVAPVQILADDAPAAFYRETETEIIVEEIIEDDREPEEIKLSALPPAATAAAAAPAPESFLTKIKGYRAIAAIVIVMIVLGAGFFLARRFWAKSTFNYSVENVRAKRLTSEGNLGNSAPISPDGNYVVYPVYFGEQGSLWLRQVQTGSVARLTPMMPAQFWAFEFSPDGNYVYYILNHTGEPAQSGLYRIPTLGGTPEKLVESAGGGLAFALDGSRFAFARPTEDKSLVEVVTAKADGSDLRRAFTIPENKFLWSLKWSPDSLNLLYSMRERDDNKTVGYVAETPWNNNSDTAIENVVFPKQENQIVINAAWTPDRTSLLLSIREPNADICQIWQYIPATGEKRRVTNDDNSYRFINLSRDGKNLSTVQESSQSEAWIADSTSLDFHPIDNVKHLGTILWTKDDKLIYEALENQQATIWMSNTDGSGRQRLTQGNDGIYLSPTLSLDGNFLTFISNRSGSVQIWRANSNGTNAQPLTNTTAPLNLTMKLLADGQTLLFMTHTNSLGWRLQKQTENGKITFLTDTDTSLWSVSPDGKLIAINIRDEKTKKYRTRIQSLDSGEVLKTFDFSVVRQLSWTRDGKALVYISPKQDMDELVLQPLDETPSKALLSTRGEKISGFDWSFDGSKIVVIRNKYIADAFIIRAQEN